jgi:hypothetical protein
MAFETLEAAGFQLEFLRHAEAILETDFPGACEELTSALMKVRIPVSELIGSGGGETKGTQRLRKGLSDAGWLKKVYEVSTTINGVKQDSRSHEVDHAKTFSEGTILFEIEWNNKDPFFDRDLESFRRLHVMSAASVGIIVTRGTELNDALEPMIGDFLEDRGVQDSAGLQQFGAKARTARQEEVFRKLIARGEEPSRALAASLVSDKFGASTTHWTKLKDRLDRGDGSPCPIVAIGLPVGVVDANL